MVIGSLQLGASFSSVGVLVAPSELEKSSKGVVSLIGTCTFVLPMHEPTCPFKKSICSCVDSAFIKFNVYPSRYPGGFGPYNDLADEGV